MEIIKSVYTNRDALRSEGPLSEVEKATFGKVVRNCVDLPRSGICTLNGKHGKGRSGFCCEIQTFGVDMLHSGISTLK